ncbi:MAG: serine hydrolase domain-containing protein [Pseudomonadota bacterium]
MNKHLARLATALVLLLPLTPASAKFDGIERWADGLVEPALASGRLGGVSIGLVEDGEVTFIKAYGWEDQAREIPLDPYKSVFRMCSMSKSFMATTMMQLIEGGEIDSLDDPVNRYLRRIQLPPPHGDEVTLRQLMTHTSGMAGHGTPQGTTRDLPTPVSREEIASYFVENIERPPGAISQYANLGVSLEGILIEDITGQALAERLDTHIFQPLGMNDSELNHSTTTPPRLVVPYGRFPNGELQAVRFFPKHPLGAASGGVLSTTADMLKYLAFHADEEALEHEDVLSGPGRATMHRAHFRNNDADWGIGLHFFPNNFGGIRVAQHGCGLPGTRGIMAVMPDINAGVVINVLSASPMPPVGDLLDLALKEGRYAPDPSLPEQELWSVGDVWDDFTETFLGEPVRPDIPEDYLGADIVSDPEKIAGTYWLERRAMSTPITLFFAGMTRAVEVGEDGKLLLDNKSYSRLAPGIYASDETGTRVFFREPWEGSPVFLSSEVPMNYRKVSGLGNPQIVAGMLIIGMLLSFVGLVALKRPAGVLQRGLPRTLAIGMPLLILALPVAALAGAELATDLIFMTLEGERGRMDTVLWLLRLHILAGAVLAVLMLNAWRQGRGSASAGGRALEYALFTAAALTWPAVFLFNLYSSW